MTAAMVTFLDRSLQAGTTSGKTSAPIVRQLSRGAPIAMLFLAAVLWGSGNVASKTILDAVGPLTTLSCRNLLGLVVLLCLIKLEPGGLPDVRWLKSALIPAVLMVGAVLPMQLAYRFTSATNVGFLVNTCAVLTPLVAWLALGHRPRWLDGMAGLGILVGAFLMSGMTVVWAHLNLGDLLCLLSALFYAAGMVALGSHLGRHGRPLLTSAMQFGVAFVMVTPMAAVVEAPALTQIWSAWPEITYLGVFSTAMACVLMAVAQRHVSASVAATITSGESVFGACAAYVILGERLSSTGLIGAAVIFCAVAAVANGGPSKAPVAREA